MYRATLRRLVPSATRSRHLSSQHGGDAARRAQLLHRLRRSRGRFERLAPAHEVGPVHLRRLLAGVHVHSRPRREEGGEGRIRY